MFCIGFGGNCREKSTFKNIFPKIIFENVVQTLFWYLLENGFENQLRKSIFQDGFKWSIKAYDF